MDESLEKCQREVGNLHLLLAAAYEEVDFIRDRVELLAAARTAELGQTVADQTALIDERDAYIRELDPRYDRSIASGHVIGEATAWRHST